MLRYISRRLLWLPVLLIIILAITFVLGVYGPGDPVVARLGARARPDAVARLREEMGLNRPIIVQYVDYVSKAVRLDLGTSLRYQNQPVTKLISERIWVTVAISALALIFSLLIGIPLGIVPALSAGRWPDRPGVSLALLFNSVPSFVAIPLSLAVFVRALHILPPPGWDGLLSTRIILPVFVLAMGPVAGLARQTRASMLEVLPQDYIRTARARGLQEHIVIFLGLGIQPPNASWGSVIYETYGFWRTKPFLVIGPGLTLALVVLGFNWLGDAVNDALNPRRQGRPVTCGFIAYVL